jgi:hypothetical protein
VFGHSSWGKGPPPRGSSGPGNTDLDFYPFERQSPALPRHGPVSLSTREAKRWGGHFARPAATLGVAPRPTLTMLGRPRLIREPSSQPHHAGGVYPGPCPGRPPRPWPWQRQPADPLLKRGRSRCLPSPASGAPHRLCDPVSAKTAAHRHRGDDQNDRQLRHTRHLLCRTVPGDARPLLPRVHGVGRVLLLAVTHEREHRDGADC